MLFRTTSLTFASLYTLSSAATALDNCVTKCSPASLTPTLPPNQTAISVPTGQNTTFVAVGRGIQNYTCSAAGTWTSIGAVAQLFDVSCLGASPSFNSIPSQVLAIPFNPLPNATCSNPVSPRSDYPEGHRRRQRRQTPLSTSLLTSALSHFCPAQSAHFPGYLGFHSFVVPSGGVLSPKFDFTQSQRNAGQYFLGKKSGSVPSPSNATSSVAWLELGTIDPEGVLATTVFRTETAGGQPPAGNCGVAGTPLSVQYAALYWFLK